MLVYNKLDQIIEQQKRFRIRVKTETMQSIQQTDLITLRVSKESERLQTLLPRISKYPKYFFNQRENALIIYDNTNLYVIAKEELRNFNLGKQFLITQLAYNVDRDVVVFLTAEGHLCCGFLVSKVLVVVRKDVKRAVFDWVYGVGTVCQLFVADEAGVRLYKVDEDKKTIKQVKNLSGKYNSFLYQPITQTLVGFPVGDCKTIQPFCFHPSKYTNWFKLPSVPINFSNDQQLVEFVKSQKSLGLDWSKNNEEVFAKNTNQRNYTKLIKLGKKCYLVFFFAQQGLLKIFAISEEKEKQVVVKLPSDSIPEFCVIDNMLVVHLKVQGITFIYDLNGHTLQPLVSPFPVRHKDQCAVKNVYEYAFVGQRAIHPKGIISKWQIQLQVIFSYLKNELQIFDFFLKRKQAKMSILRWIRRDLFKIKQIHLSRFWKSLFMKYLSNIYPQSQVINLIDLFSNVFYTLSQQELIPKQKLLNIIVQCIRQAIEVKMTVPLQLQMLLFELLMQFRRYELLVYLLHHDVIKDSPEIIKKVTHQYSKTHDMMLGTLAVDMTFRAGSYKDMVKVLMKFQRVRDAKKFIKQNYDKIDVLYLIEVAKYIKNQYVLEDYLKFIKSFILLKYPTMNIAYLNEAQQKLFKNSKNAQITNTDSQPETKQKRTPNLLQDF